MKDSFFINYGKLLGKKGFVLASNYFRNPFDRGKVIEPGERGYSYDKNISTLYLNPYLFVRNGWTLMNACCEEFVYELIAEVGYCLEEW